ncbi:hypothetical protein GCM10027200_28550 [Lentzea nigeriaca]
MAGRQPRFDHEVRALLAANCTVGLISKRLRQHFSTAVSAATYMSATIRAFGDEHQTAQPRPDSTEHNQAATLYQDHDRAKISPDR